MNEQQSKLESSIVKFDSKSVQIAGTQGRQMLRTPPCVLPTVRMESIRQNWGRNVDISDFSQLRSRMNVHLCCNGTHHMTSADDIRRLLREAVQLLGPLCTTLIQDRQECSLSPPKHPLRKPVELDMLPSGPLHMLLEWLQKGAEVNCR